MIEEMAWIAEKIVYPIVRFLVALVGWSVAFACLFALPDHLTRLTLDDLPRMIGLIGGLIVAAMATRP